MVLPQIVAKVYLGKHFLAQKALFDLGVDPHRPERDFNSLNPVMELPLVIDRYLIVLLSMPTMHIDYELPRAIPQLLIDHVLTDRVHQHKTFAYKTLRLREVSVCHFLVCK